MPTPEEAIARADALHAEANAALKAHHARTGQIDPGLQMKLHDAAHAAGTIRAAVAQSQMSPEAQARHKTMMDTFPNRLAHSLVGKGIEGKGRQYMYQLSDDQFSQWEKTGAWEGEPRPKGPDIG